MAARTVCLAILLVAVGGCASQVAVGPVSGKAYEEGTAAFDEAVRTFKVSPVEASRSINEVIRQPDAADGVVDTRPHVVIGRYYLFDVPQFIFYPLEGYYMNGDTGEVIFQSDTRVLKVGMFRTLYPAGRP